MIRNACELRLAAREALAQKWGGAVVLMLVMTLVSSLASSVPVVGPLLALLLLPMEWGTAVAFLDVKRNGGQYELSMLMNGYKDTSRILGTLLLETLYICLWLLCLIVPGIIKAYSYAMTNYILRDDKEIRYDAAIEKSMAMMNGHKAELFYLHLTFIGWILLSILTCGIAFLWVGPYMQAAEVQFYEDLKAEYEAKQAV